MNQPRRFFIPTYLTFILTGTVTTLLGSLAPGARGVWGISDLQVGQLFAAQFLASVVATTATSVVLARLAAPQTIALGALLMGVGTAELAFLPWPWLILSVATYGAGIGFTIPAANLWAAESAGARSVGRLNLLNFFWSAGAVIAPPLIVRQGSRQTLREIFLVIAVALFVLALAHLSKRIEVKLLHPVAAPRHGTCSSASILLLIALMFFFYGGAENGFSGWIASYEVHVRAISLIWAGWSVAAFWAALLTGRLAASFASERVTPTRMIAVSIVVAIAGGILFVAGREPSSMLFGLALTGIGLAPIFPSIVALFTGLARSEAARSTGPVFAAGGLGGAAIPWLMGWTSSRTSSLSVAINLPIVAIAAIALCLTMVRTLSTRDAKR